MEERKVIQIFPIGGTIVALCNDGTIWQLTGGPLTFNWEPMPAIPTDVSPR